MYEWDISRTPLLGVILHVTVADVDGTIVTLVGGGLLALRPIYEPDSDRLIESVQPID